MNPSWNHNYAQIARDSGFKFQHCDDGILNWKLISSIDIDRIIKEKNFENIEKILYHLSEVPLGVLLNNQILDNGIIKYFHLSQLSLQYLLFCVKFLDETILKLRTSLKDIQNEKDEYQKLYVEANQEILKLHKKCEYLENLNEIIYPCSLCTKNFISNDMLNLHMKKRHSNEQLQSKNSKKSETDDRNLINTIKLELEIKQLKEKLNSLAEEKETYKRSCIYSNHQPCQHQSNASIYHHEFDEMKKSKIDRAINTGIISYSTTEDLRNLDVSTQTSNLVEVNSIGIQNNLNEIKEKDDDEIIDMNQKHLYDILAEIKDKISDLSKNVHNKDDSEVENVDTDRLSVSSRNQKNFDSMEIYDKLNKILYGIENMNLKRSHSDDGDGNEHIDYDKKRFLEDNLQMIQNTIKENILKSNYMNELKINDMLKKFEAHLQESLEHIGHQQAEKIATNPIVIAPEPQLKRKVESMKKLNLVNKLTTKIDYESDTRILDEHFQRDKFQKKIYKKQKPSEFIIDDDEDEENDIIKKLNKSEVIDQGPQKVEMEVKESKFYPENVIFKRPNPITFTKNDCLKILNSRLKMLGINPNQKSITDSDKSKMFKRLDEIHKNQKLKYPKFLITRNKVKRWVDRISSEKIKMKGNISKTNDDLGAENTIDDQNKKQINPTRDFPDNIDQFKLRLEKILESPIRKPNIIHNRVAKLNDNSESNKPVPAPRKVTFNKITRISSDDDEL